jgi:hypothetical protein
MPVEVEQESGRRSVMMRFVLDDITRIKKKEGRQQNDTRSAYQHP